MLDLNAWDILALLAIFCVVLSFFSRGKAIWAGLLFGIIMTTYVESFSLAFGKGFYLPIAERIIAVSVLTGFLVDLVYRLMRPGA